MDPNPFLALAHSRKFWLMLLDVVTTTILYFGSKYVGESTFADIKFLMVTIQPVFLTVIYSYTTENTATIRADSLRIQAEQRANA